MAEAILNKIGKGKFRALSAGSQPKGSINPNALDLLKQLNYDTDGLRSKSWHEFTKPDAPQFDFIFTVCDNAAGEFCPVWPGKPATAHWGVPDPAGVEGGDEAMRAAFKTAYNQLARRIQLFMSLPIESLDKLTLKQKLAEIGRIQD